MHGLDFIKLLVSTSFEFDVWIIFIKNMTLLYRDIIILMLTKNNTVLYCRDNKDIAVNVYGNTLIQRYRCYYVY